jgi:hypothetical protein
MVAEAQDRRSGGNEGDTMSDTIWQIAAGSDSRDYTSDFIQFGMAFVGGPDQIARMHEVAEGDVVVLKRGQSRISAVGRVVTRDGRVGGCNDKAWLRDFDGWDLPAYCYVDWHVPDEPIDVQGLTRSTIQRVNQPHLRETALRVLDDYALSPILTPEPPPTNKIADDDMLEFLVREGLRPSAAEDLTDAFRRIRLLARYYYNDCDWKDVREHETRTFLIIPLLVALGWPEQRMKIELGVKNGRVDIACFTRPYRRVQGNANGHDCALLLESKGFSQGLYYAHSQAKDYAESFPNCSVVVVSNGYCYKTYRRTDAGDFSLKPSAYLNLLNPQDAYPLDPVDVKGCFEVLRLLLPTTTSSQGVQP